MGIRGMPKVNAMIFVMQVPRTADYLRYKQRLQVLVVEYLTASPAAILV